MSVGWKGLPAWVLERAGVTDGQDGLVRLPYRLADGSLYAQRVVAPNGRRWWEPGDGRRLIAFGLDQLEPDIDLRRYRALAICEGESDTLAIRAAFPGQGLDAVGIPGATCWKPIMARALLGYAATYILGDGDGAGVRFALSVKQDLRDALAIFLPPKEDVRAIVQRDPSELANLVAEVERLRQLVDLQPPTLVAA